MEELKNFRSEIVRSISNVNCLEDDESAIFDVKDKTKILELTFRMWLNR